MLHRTSIKNLCTVLLWVSAGLANAGFGAVETQEHQVTAAAATDTTQGAPKAPAATTGSDGTQGGSGETGGAASQSKKAVRNGPAAAQHPPEKSEPPRSGEGGNAQGGKSGAAAAAQGGHPLPAARAAGQPSQAAPAEAPQAGEKPNGQDLSAVVRDLLDSLVDQGVLTRDKADAVLRTMLPRLQGAAEAKRPPPPANPNVVGVPYVPEFVKDDIREQLRKEMGQDVLQDVLAKAKKERWGVPGALPQWVNRINIYGDIRLRAQADVFAAGNAVNFYPDVVAINKAGGIAKVTYPYLNTTVNRYRLRLRGRLGLDAAVASRLKIGIMITTGNTLNPVTFNQDLGNYGGPFQVVWNKFYLRYQSERSDGSPSLTVWGGRFPDPWFHTDLVWYNELDFQGVAATQRLYFHAPAVSQTDPARGHDYLFMTLAAVPIQNIQVTTNDKWLFGAQLGTDLRLQRHTTFKIAAAYYNYANIAGKRNAPNSSLLDYTAPEFKQNGNTIYDIRVDPNDPSTNLYALAANYHLVNVTAKLDLAQLAPTHVILFADYVKNTGYNENQIFQRTGEYIRPRTVGYQFGITVGWPQDQIAEHGRWQIYGAYKYLQRDAVLDAYTDSNFHLGGTDAKGFIIRAEYGMTSNAWLALHWYSSNAIDGAPYGVDTLQLGVLAKF